MFSYTQCTHTHVHMYARTYTRMHTHVHHVPTMFNRAMKDPGFTHHTLALLTKTDSQRTLSILLPATQQLFPKPWHPSLHSSKVATQGCLTYYSRGQVHMHHLGNQHLHYNPSLMPVLWSLTLTMSAVFTTPSLN